MQQEHWIADRAMLQRLMQLHPEWTQQELADWIGRSVGWVKKWRKRLREAPPGHLQRTPGPRAILYYLPRDPALHDRRETLPRSTRTIWRILRRNGRISQERRRKRKPLERRQPLEEVQIDFKDVSSIPADPAGKKQHVIEVFNFVDAGTSILLDAQVQADFHAQTVLEAVIRFLYRYGLPPSITFDRDPRFVGGATGRDFPSPLVRLLLCLGIQPNICPPRRPDKNCYVERYHRTFNQECLQVHRPHTLEQVREMTASFLIHYNTERPNQALSCGNRPPRVAFPTLPSLPPLPTFVDPDAWLQQIHEQHFIRKVRQNGTVRIADGSYYIHMNMIGQYVDLCVDAPQQVFVIWHQQHLFKQVPIKGLQHSLLPFEEFAPLMCQQALSEQRRLLQAQQGTVVTAL